MIQERLSIDSSPKANREATSLMVVAKKVFAGFVADDHGNNPLPPESLTIIKINGAKQPLYVLTNREISLDPTSHSRWVGIVPNRISRAHLAIEFGNGPFFSSLGILSENCLSVTENTRKRDVAVIHKGKLNLDYLIGNQTIAACVVFAGISGKMSMGDIKSWGGFVVID